MTKKFTVRPKRVAASSTTSKKRVMAAERDWSILEKASEELPRDLTPEQFLIWSTPRFIGAGDIMSALLDRVSSEDELLELIEDFGLTSMYHVIRGEW